MITIDEFKKIELKTAKVLKAEKVEKADKLLKMTIQVGEEQRTLVAGISKYYEPSEMEGKTIIIVANLEPRKLMGIESQGMLLAVSDENGLALLTTDKEIASGLTAK